MDDVVRAALRAAQASGIEYADVRVQSPQRYEALAVRNGEACALTASTGAGVGVRVRTELAWGFGTVAEVSVAAARTAARLAVRSARSAEGSCRRPIAVVPSRGPSNGRYASRVRKNPFDVDRSEKVELLRDAEKALHVGPEVKSGHASMQAWENVTRFASSEGVSYTSHIVHVGAGLDATAAAHGEVQRRSGPNSFGGDYGQAGYEFIERLGLPERAPLVGKEAVALLDAPACPTATTTVVLASDQLALQVHESVGHATELDRVLGSEAGFAGTSFLAPADRGSLQYGSEWMSIVADATEAGGLGTFGWDDEGCPAVRTTLVDRGRLAGFLTNRETAAALGLPRSGATARAGGYDRAPLIRMTNVDLAPGDHSFEELLEGVDDGVYFETNRSWSIDDKRLNFQFGTEVGRTIVHGELGPLVRNPIYAGMTPSFWGSLDAAGDASTWHLWGIPNCGKGQPIQAARVGHGAPAGRFRNVRVRGG
ncbi:MAG TPA: TldD/PmbA family protein [Thermoplasmata archaeon]|nr:TldD/PmbA family protein [Thermoplasmata archaeon]